MNYAKRIVYAVLIGIFCLGMSGTLVVVIMTSGTTKSSLKQ